MHSPLGWGEDVPIINIKSNHVPSHSPKDQKTLPTKASSRKHGLENSDDFRTSSTKKSKVNNRFQKQYGSEINISLGSSAEKTRPFMRRTGARTSNPLDRSRCGNADEMAASPHKIVVGSSLTRSSSRATEMLERSQRDATSCSSSRASEINSLSLHESHTSKSKVTHSKKRGRGIGDAIGSFHNLPAPRNSNSAISPGKNRTSKSSKSIERACYTKRVTRATNKIMTTRKSSEVIDLIDDDDDDDDEVGKDDLESIGYKNRLAKIVGASVDKPCPKKFGELENFALVELYIGKERFTPRLKNESKSCIESFHSHSSTSNECSREPCSCSVTVNLPRAHLKLFFSKSDHPILQNEYIDLDSIKKISYSRVANSKECFAIIERTSEEGEDDAIRKAVLLIFYDDNSILSFDKALIEYDSIVPKRSPLDLSTYLRNTAMEDKIVYDACKNPLFYSLYYELAREKGASGRKRLRMSRKARKQTNESMYNDVDSGKVLFCFPNDEYAQDTISFLKNDYYRLTDGEFFNDNIIDLQMKRMVLDTADKRGKRLNSSHQASKRDAVSELGENEKTSEKHEKEDQEDKIIRESKTNFLSPHNISPVYAFSCMFFPKFTGVAANGKITKENMREAHSVVFRWTKHVDIFDKDFLFFPVNDGAHWSLVCVVRPGCKFPSEVTDADESDDKPTNYPCMLFLDSLALHDKSSIYKTIACYLTQEWLEKKNSERNFCNRKDFPLFDLCSKIPSQVNSYDCGVYLTMYAKKICSMYPSSTKKDCDRKFSQWFSPSLFSAEDVENERVSIKSFCDLQANRWEEILLERKLKEAQEKKERKEKIEKDEENCSRPDKDDSSSQEALDGKSCDGGNEEATESTRPEQEALDGKSCDGGNEEATESTRPEQEALDGKSCDGGNEEATESTRPEQEALDGKSCDGGNEEATESTRPEQADSFDQKMEKNPS